uniref:Uncharacterized protein AlNc14C87G5564 n=1 Tax=Albugo laibachii Nc14 TaxID=890382 RepID=F0WG32_9STRA|nr:conserved hypothetical protein [Albugo laibachii Nc14]|eukprot:CCA20166.1 conserved hypothetical protein [Albugo laibachii Nc14]
MVQQHCIGASHDSYAHLGQPPSSKESMETRPSRVDSYSHSYSPVKCVRAQRCASYAVSDRVREENTKANTSTSFSFGVKSNAEFSGQSFLDIIATYSTNFGPNWYRNANQSHVESFESPLNQQNGSKEASVDWGWFTDIDSSSESWNGNNGMSSTRKKVNETCVVPSDTSLFVLGDEQIDTGVTVTHKSFAIVNNGMTKIIPSSISIPRFRIVQPRHGTDRHAQYLITLRLENEYYAKWRRYSEFSELVNVLQGQRYQRSLKAWKSIETRWFNRLEPSYLHQKCVGLENFMREFMYELHEPTVLIQFLGGYTGKLNTRPTQGDLRPAAQLPKELRPQQPKHERELFEKLWAENFKRSSVAYVDPPL